MPGGRPPGMLVVGSVHWASDQLEPQLGDPRLRVQETLSRERLVEASLVQPRADQLAAWQPAVPARVDRQLVVGSRVGVGREPLGPRDRQLVRGSLTDRSVAMPASWAEVTAIVIGSESAQLERRWQHRVPSAAAF